uniref:DNA polymerase II subunit 2 n=1 Tax=Oreochromis aureus TaxID=47969 RepID=A0A668T408_OREAU
MFCFVFHFTECDENCDFPFSLRILLLLLFNLVHLTFENHFFQGKFYLEDPKGKINTSTDSVFHVNGFGFPPTEPSSATRAYYGNINFFGGPSTTSVKMSTKLKQLEEENEDAMFVIVSDVWLDSVEVMEKLNIMFSGYAAMPPTCFIFCGNFSSAPYGKTQLKSLKVSLTFILSRFVFVPGPEDPGPGTILPRPPLADHITEEFRQRVPFSVFTTNPCRIQYCSQELIIIREDLVNKMCRNCVRLPNNNLDIPNHFVRTILSQGHLTPLPLYVSPVFWAYDFSLRVYPVPDVIVFADKYDPFSITNTDCLCVNPGSFPKSGFSFKVYYPSNRTVEDRWGLVLKFFFSLCFWRI